MAALLADAFDQDPVFTFLLPPESSRRHKRMTRLFGEVPASTATATPTKQATSEQTRRVVAR